MKKTRTLTQRLAAALLAGGALPGALAADLAPAPRQADPANPTAAAPPIRYSSVFTDPVPLEAPGATAWVGANAEVARFPRGHIDILKWEAANPGAEPASAATRPVSAKKDGQP